MVIALAAMDVLPHQKRAALFPKGGPPDCQKAIGFDGFTEFRPPQRTEQNAMPSFPGTCASEMTLLMQDRVTFAQAIEPCPACIPFVKKGPRPFLTSLRAAPFVRDGPMKDGNFPLF